MNDRIQRWAEKRATAGHLGETRTLTSTTADVTDLAPGWHRFAAFESEAYVRQGDCKAGFADDTAERIDPGEDTMILILEGQRKVTYRCASGGELRITPRDWF